VQQAAGLDSYTDVFSEAAVEPAIGTQSIKLTISDPAQQYLPRHLQINLPRDADPAHSGQSDSLFRPLTVKLYAAASAALQTNWSTVRVAVTRQQAGADDTPVAGALLRVVRNSDRKILSSGLSDQRGEALVVVPGIPIVQFADEEDSAGDAESDTPSPVMVSEISATLEVSLPAHAQWPVDPDELERNHDSNLVASKSLTLRTGRMEKLTIQLTS